MWIDERLPPEGFVRLVSTPAPGWHVAVGGRVWVNGDSSWALPRNAYAFWGAGEQSVFIVPSHDSGLCGWIIAAAAARPALSARLRHPHVVPMLDL